MQKVAIITGASSGLGAEFARSLSAQGYRLLLIARREEKLQEVAQSIHTIADILPLDLTEVDACKKVVDYLNTHELQPSLLINNAGFGAFDTALEIDINKQEAMIDLNVKALTKLGLTIAALMKEAHGGQILNVASIAAFCPCPNLAVYGATKAYVLAFTENLAAELHPFGITVTALCPGPVRTDFWSVAGVDRTQSFDFCMSEAKDVVRDGLKALQNEKLSVTSGMLNKTLYGVIRCVPRSLSLRVAQAIMNTVLKKNKRI